VSDGNHKSDFSFTNSGTKSTIAFLKLLSQSRGTQYLSANYSHINIETATISRNESTQYLTTGYVLTATILILKRLIGA